MDDAVTVWPDLPYASWRETAATLPQRRLEGWDRKSPECPVVIPGQVRRV